MITVLHWCCRHSTRGIRCCSISMYSALACLCLVISTAYHQVLLADAAVETVGLCLCCQVSFAPWHLHTTGKAESHFNTAASNLAHSKFSTGSFRDPIGFAAEQGGGSGPGFVYLYSQDGTVRITVLPGSRPVHGPCGRKPAFHPLGFGTGTWGLAMGELHNNRALHTAKYKYR